MPHSIGDEVEIVSHLYKSLQNSIESDWNGVENTIQYVLMFDTSTRSFAVR
jgi:hypothetical protein